MTSLSEGMRSESCGRKCSTRSIAVAPQPGLAVARGDGEIAVADVHELDLADAALIVLEQFHTPFGERNVREQLSSVMRLSSHT